MKRFLKHLLVVFLILAFASPALAVERRRRGDDQINDPCSNLPISQNGLIFRSEPNCPRGRGSAQILPDMSGYGRNLEQTVLANQAPLTGSGRRQGRWYEADNFMPQQNLQNVTLSGVTISAVAGTAFINANTSLINLSNYVGKELVLCDSSGFTTDDQMKGILASSGTVEMLGDTLNVSTCENAATALYSTFDTASSSGFHAASLGTVAARAGTADELSFTAGDCVKVVFTMALNAGTMPTVGFSTTLVGGTISPAYTPAAGLNTMYIVINASTTAVFRFLTPISVTTDFTVSSLVIKKVTTPDSTGVWINSPSAAKTWAMDGLAQGINWNDTSYTLKIREPAFSITGPFTWEGMVWFTTGTPLEAKFIVSKGDVGLNLRQWDLYLQTTGALKFRTSDNGTSPTTATSPVVFAAGPSKWTHIVVIYRGSVMPEIWVNGVNQTLTGSSDATLFNTTSAFMLGGRLNNGAITQVHEGGIGGNSFWSRALTGSEVVQMYNWRR